jgi:hypothetical protein
MLAPRRNTRGDTIVSGDVNVVKLRLLLE